MAVELRALDSVGNYGEILPDWSDLTFSQDLVGAGSLDFKYPLAGRHADLLVHGVQLVVLIDGVEPTNGRFTYFEGTGARTLGADAATATYGCGSNLYRFNQLILGPTFTSQVADDALFAWTNKSPGNLMITGVTNSLSRANQFATPAISPWLTTPLAGFTTTADSSGTAWPQTFDVTFSQGAKVYDIIDWLIDKGQAEPQMVGKVLRLYRPDKNGRDLTVGSDPVALQTGRDFTEATYQTTSREMVNALLVLGDGTACKWVYDTAAINANGYREGSIKVSGATTQGTLQAAGDAWLTLRKTPRYSYTYAVAATYLDGEGPHRPFIDYQVGDTVLVLDGYNTSAQRLRLLSATWPSAGVATIQLTVNDFLAEREVRFERTISRLGMSS